MPYCILVVGRPKQGKTTYLKNFIKKISHLIIDPNNHYKGYNRYTAVDRVKDTLLPEIYKQYQQYSTSKRDNGLNFLNKAIVFEEAGLMFNNRSHCKILEDLLIIRRHSGSKGNMYIFVYHSIRKIPQYIKDLTDYIILFKTNDTIEQAATFADPKTMEKAITMLQKAPNFKRIRVDLQ